MYENIKKKLAHYLLSKKYLKNGGSQVLFNKIISSSFDFFVILPINENELNNSLELIKYLLIHKKKITIFLEERHYNLLPAKEKVSSITFTRNDITRLNLPSKNLYNKLKYLKFDVVIDLCRTENTFLSAVSNIVNSKVRVSFIKELSEQYYNLLYFDNNNEPEVAFRNFLNFISMF